MVACPVCSTPFALRRWYKTGGGRYGSMETRCNGCNAKIEVYVPTVVWLGVGALLPMLALIYIANLHSEAIGITLAVLFVWMLASPFILFHLFGRIRLTYPWRPIPLCWCIFP